MEVRKEKAMRRFREDDDIEVRNKKKKKKGSVMQAIAILNIFMPYILSVLFSVVLFSLFGLLGTVGDFIRNPLLGAFSIAGSALFAILLLYHAIVWKYDLKHKICIRRVICSLIAVISISMLQHLIQFDDFNTLRLNELWNNGIAGDGGGIVGGLLSYFLHEAATGLGAIAIVLVVLLFMLLQMFNITPFSMVSGLFRLIFRKSKTPKKEKAPKEKPERLKRAKRLQFLMIQAIQLMKGLRRL